ncbi:MAG: hypothetical protein KBF70_09125 [Moraxellaceae bacterium]|nr:hypothetical protein [Moraxellaceae bacterium]
MTDTTNKSLQAALEQCEWPTLLRLCRQVLRKTPTHLLANRFLGFALHKLKREQESAQAFTKSIVYWPKDSELLLNFAQCLMETGKQYEATPFLETIVKLRPKEYLPWLKLSQALYPTQNHHRGYSCALITESLASNDSERAAALIQKAIHRRELGQVKEAIQDCQAALVLNPNDLSAYTNKLLFMLADPDVSALDLRKAAGEYAAAAEDPLKPGWPRHDPSGKSPWQKLRIGFLSPDFRNHAVMYSVEGILAQLDRRQFSVIALHLHPGSDSITERVKKHADTFLQLANRTFNEQVELIRHLKLDIMIDLAGHTGNNGLLLMATKIAPVQISWLGFPATTGLTAIDYKFTDEVTDQPNSESEYSEQLYRLPTFFCCYRPHSRNPLWRYQPAYLVKPTPALRENHITFGSCNNLGKLTDTALKVWGTILRRIPDARLLIEGKNLENIDFKTKYRSRCESLGIPCDRLDLVPLDIRNQYLTYHRIDIALDPFPLTGGTTTFDLLWMGIPLVSLEGDCFKSRLSTGILTYLNQTDWLAHSQDEYIDIACSLAANIDRLNQYRMNLRQRMESSCLMNEDIHTKEFGNGLRHIWQSWLANSITLDDAEATTNLIGQWLSNPPDYLRQPYQKEVGIKTGERLSRQQAYDHLQELLDFAKRKGYEMQSGKLDRKEWVAVTEFCETILCAIPHDPLALACLAEVEHAHGNTEFAVTYLRYAQQAMINTT